MENKNKKNSRAKWAAGGLGLLALGVFTIFGIDYFAKNKNKSKTKDAPPDIKTEPDKKVIKKQNSVTKKTMPVKKKGVEKTKFKTEGTKKENRFKEATFPLQLGDRGKLVKTLQVELLKKFGDELLPIDKDNGIYGEELDRILRSLKVPTVNGKIVLTEALYKRIISPEPEHYKRLAELLINYIESPYFNGVMSILKEITNVAYYKTVSTHFLNYRSRGVKQTIVTALLSTFQEKSQQQKIRAEFLRIGLKYDGQKWSLYGLEGTQLIITTQATTVWKDAKTSVPVPVNMVLGKEITRRGDYTLFENDKLHFLVESKSIKPYQQSGV